MPSRQIIKSLTNEPCLQSTIAPLPPYRQNPISYTQPQSSVVILNPKPQRFWMSVRSSPFRKPRIDKTPQPTSYTSTLKTFKMAALKRWLQSCYVWYFVPRSLYIYHFNNNNYKPQVVWWFFSRFTRTALHCGAGL